MIALAEAAAAADGVSPLSEQVLLHLRYGGGRTARNLLLRRGPDLAGYAHLGPAEPGGGRSGELVVHPAHRRHGFGMALVWAALAEPDALPVQMWAHGDLPAAAGLAAAAGFTRVRALWQMRRPLRDPVAEPRLPAGITLRTFVPGQDEDAWLSVNARAFAHHPEQGKWTADDLRHREAEDWFDPAGFFLAERDGRLAGFHWTKVHQPDGGGPDDRRGPGDDGGPGGSGGAGDDGAGDDGQHGRGAVGEVYVVGVDPAEQGTGLGKALTLTGLQHLRDRGLPAVMLYVDQDNTAAIRLYGSLGFEHTGTDVMYRADRS